MAAHHAAMTSWSIKFGKKDESGTVKRWRVHYNASLQRPGTPEEHRAQRAKAHDLAKERAKALTQDPNVVWVSVYPPYASTLFNRPWDGKRLAPVCKWTRRKGWWIAEGE